MYAGFTARALGCAIVLGLAASPVGAAVVPFSFNLTTGNNNNVQDGNARFFSANSQWGKFNVRATGWSLETLANGSTFVRQSKLMVYNGATAGLGVISGDDQNGGSNQHTIDNGKRKDFVLLQFDRQIKLTGATFNTYNVLNAANKDSDAIVAWGTTPTNNWNQSLGLHNKGFNALATMFSGSLESNTTATGNSTRSFNQAGASGDLWLIGAAFNNSDGRIDGFKLSAISAIPEPATWAMMIGGFGLVGAAARRRTQGQALSA